MNTIKKISIISIASMFLLGLMLFAMPPTNVYAQAPADEPLPPAGEDGKQQQAVLERLFNRAQKNHENQERLITQADKLGNRFAELIARAKGNGKDTEALGTALSDFNEKIGEARLKYDQTGKLIKQHTGFDDAGKVVDTKAARATLEEIHAGRIEVRQTVGDAMKGLGEAGKVFREANPRPADSPTANPA